MKQSLLSRFQGGLIGSFIAPQKAGLSNEEHSLSTGEHIAIHAIDTLISQGSWQKEAWLADVTKDGETALAILPLALFFHDHPSLLIKHLQQGMQEQSAIDAQLILLWSQALVLALTEKLIPTQLLSQLLAQSATASTTVRQKLEQAQNYITQRASLTTVVQELACPIILALYCFASTPEDFRLCVARASQTNYQPEITAALTGAIAGIYNGCNDIPIAWRCSCTPLINQLALKKRAQQLFAVWSGVYHPNSPNHLFPLAAIASPQVIQPRSVTILRSINNHSSE